MTEECPIAREHAKAIRAPALRYATPVSQLHVLIVDDEKNIRSTLRVCLEGLGAEVAESASPQAALDAMARAAYDVVFLDLVWVCTAAWI